MTTREENLKKINDELEKLSDEQLEQVAGGDMQETEIDSHLLYDYGLISKWSNETYLLFHWKSSSAKIDSAWAKAGITCVTSPWAWEGNKYFAGSKQISREEAVKILKQKFTRIHYTYSDDDYLG